MILFATTPLIQRSFDLWNDHENQCTIFNRLQKLKVIPPETCPYNEVKDLSYNVMLMGIIFHSLLVFLLGVLLVFIICLPKCRRGVIDILTVLLAMCVAVGAAIPACFMAMDFEKLYDFQYKNEVLNWTSLHSNMNSSLLKNFVSDYTGGNEISNQWNFLFIDYKCCGVDTVYGTTNDFDSTPWCTTHGSCQQTNSQIPKSCCLGVSKENFQSADVKCHAQVSPQQYNDKGCYLALKEKIESIKHNSNIKDVLKEEMKVFMAMGVCIILPGFGIVAIVYDLIRKKCCKSSTQKKVKLENGSTQKEKENSE